MKPAPRKRVDPEAREAPAVMAVREALAVRAAVRLQASAIGRPADRSAPPAAHPAAGSEVPRPGASMTDVPIPAGARLVAAAALVHPARANPRAGKANSTSRRCVTQAPKAQRAGRLAAWGRCVTSVADRTQNHLRRD